MERLMTLDDSPRFFQALAAMGLIFSDDLSKDRQRLYWEIFRDRITLAEWEYACHQAISRETFHKVPLPAVLMDYVRECRQAHERQLRLEEAQAREAARIIEQAQRVLLEASPAWQAEQAAKREAQENAVREAIADLNRKWGIDWRLMPETVPSRQRFRRLSEEELRYQPHENPEEAKAKLREQLRLLQAED